MERKRALQICCIWCLGWMIFLTGCEMEKESGKGRETVEFTVVNPDDIPVELAEVIEENKQGEIRLSYEDQGYRYLVRGYGQQKTGGYSITVNEIYRLGDEIHADTSLIGPQADQVVKEEASYPYLVIKIKGQEGEVIFE